jgi:hypothetical protein
MISFEDAKKIAERYIAALEPTVGMKLMLIDDATIERNLGWVFFYNTRSFLESGQFSDCLAGNAPIIVERFDGRLHETGTAYPVEHYIDEVEKQRTI